MKVQGAGSGTALYFVVQGHCVSLEVFYLWASPIMFLCGKWRAWDWWALEPFPLQASVRIEPGVEKVLGGSYLCFLFFHSWKDLKAKMIMGHWIETKYIYNWCFLGILPVTWVNNGNGMRLLGRQEWGWFSPLCSYHSRCHNKLNQHQGCSILAVSCLKWSAIFQGKKTKHFFSQHLSVISGDRISFSRCCCVGGLLCVCLLCFIRNVACDLFSSFLKQLLLK